MKSQYLAVKEPDIEIILDINKMYFLKKKKEKKYSVYTSGKQLLTLSLINQIMLNLLKLFFLIQRFQ